MTETGIKLSVIRSVSTLSAEGYTVFGDISTGLSDVYLTADVIVSRLDDRGTPGGMQPLFGVFTTESPATLVIIKSRSAFVSQAFSNFGEENRVFDGLIEAPMVEAVGSTPGTVVEIFTGNGIVLPVSAFTNAAVALEPLIVISFNFTRPPAIEEQLSITRQITEIAERQKEGIQTRSSYEYTLGLTKYELDGVTTNSPVPENRKLFNKIVLSNTKSKDRRNIISSLVNNYSRATKRS